MTEVPEESTGTETDVGADVAAPEPAEASAPTDGADAPESGADRVASLREQLAAAEADQLETDNPAADRPVCERCGQKIPAEPFDHPGVDAWCPTCNQRLPELLPGS